MAVLFHLREAFRSGDIWLAHSRRFGELKETLVRAEVARATPRLAVPFEPESWLADRKARMSDALRRLVRVAKAGAIPGGAMVLDRYGRLPEIRVTDLLLAVDDEVGFTEAFTHLHTGAPCKDRIGLLNVLLAEGLNLGLEPRSRGQPTPTITSSSRACLDGMSKSRPCPEHWPW